MCDHGLKPGNMKCGVNAVHGGGKFGMDSSGANDSGDGEGAIKPETSLLLHSQGKVSHRLPHSLSQVITRGLKSFPVRCVHSGTDPQQVGMGQSPGASPVADKSLGRGDLDLLLLTQEKWQLIFHTALKRRQAGGGGH